MEDTPKRLQISIPPEKAIDYMLKDRAYSVLPIELRSKCFPWVSREKGLRSPYPVDMNGIDYYHVWKECTTIYQIFRSSLGDTFDDPYPSWIPLARTFVIHEETACPHPTDRIQYARHPCIAQNGNGFMYVLVGQYDFETDSIPEKSLHGIWITKI